MSASPLLPDLADALALLLRATLLIGAAWAAAVALRRCGASAAARHMAWFLGIAALLALPVLWNLAPALNLPILPAEAATAAAGSPIMAPPPPALTGPGSPEAPVQAGWSLLLLAAYVLGAAALLLRLVVGRLILKRLWRDAGAICDPAWQNLLCELCSGMGLTRKVELRISRGPAVPMTWGSLAPKLLLPAEACEWPPERRRLVLLHELAHVARLDSFSRSVASLACALYWFHPGAWLAARQMRLEQEHAADDHVLVAGGSPQAYALSLLHLARGAGAGPHFAQAAAMAGMYQLERRLVSITGPARRDRPGAFFLSSSALIGGCTTLLVAAGVPVSAATTMLDPARAERADTAPSIGKDLVSMPAAGAAMTSRRAETDSPAPTGPGENAVAQRSGSERTASQASAMAQRELPRRDGPVPGGSEPTDIGAEESRDRLGASAGQLPDYGWQLPQHGSNGRIVPYAASSSRPARLVEPPPPSPRRGAIDRTRPPKWTQIVPRLLLSKPSTRSGPPRVEGAELSLSVEMGAP